MKTPSYLLIGAVLLLSLLASLPAVAKSDTNATIVQLQWVGSSPSQPMGQSWGVPFEKGEIKVRQAFVLKTADGESVPVQSWPLAYWPDGSVKWMGFAAPGVKGAPLSLHTTNATVQVEGLSVRSSANQTIITDHNRSYTINHSGNEIIANITLDGKKIASRGRLIARLHRGDATQQLPRHMPVEQLAGTIEKVVTEQAGPLRVVIKVSGMYASDSGKFHSSSGIQSATSTSTLKQTAGMLPFTVRLYFYKGIESVQLVHSFVYDGDQDRDFIGGIGIEFGVPFREALYNRHVGFTSTEGGIWRESVQPLVTRHPLQLEGMRNVAGHQAAGNRVPEITASQQPAWNWVQHLPSWDAFKLTQLHPGGFTIAKRTQSNSSWLQATTGKRSNGMVVAADVSGGIGLSMKDFWQSFPVSMEVEGARSSQATLRSWFWSPDADPMDLRHYDTIAHDLDATYEDVQPGLSTPYGVARTHELTLFVFNDLPSSKELVGMAAQAAGIHRLIPTPSYLHRMRAFGTWSLPDRSNPTRRWMEEQLDSSFHFYQRAVEEHQWYGFWNYGDVMHTYDASRHAWRYDIGGYAWANTELAPNNWLWYSFLRTGRADIFRMAEAMTRHTGDVDVYHLGSMKGLGTRHNVSHWGCGAKEARIGQAAWKRFHYYLTTDDRSGDLMREALEVEKAMMVLEPLRIAQPKDKFPYGGPTRLRWGPDWLALAGNWLTEWERTGDTRYRDKLVTGLNSLMKLPDGLFTGTGGLSYDPASGRMWFDGREGATNKNHLSTIMSGFEILTELEDMLNHPFFKKTLVEYGTFYSMPGDDPRRNDSNRRWGDIGFLNPRMTGYAAAALNDSALAARAWREFLNPRFGNHENRPQLYSGSPVTPPDVHTLLHENVRVSTNSTSQWGLNAIILPELIGKFLPDSSFQNRQKEFEALSRKFTKVVFSEKFNNKREWQPATTKNKLPLFFNSDWFADGQKLQLSSTGNSLLFKAGPTAASDADHSVLWTKKEFSGDIKIEFDFTRRDEATRYVNILYLYAQGSGEAPYEKDISRWNTLREVPAMKQYFNHMNLFHVSFAAFENENTLPGADYIRARRYLPSGGKGLTGTDLQPEYFNTGFFEPDVLHHFTLIRKGDTVWMEISAGNRRQLYHWTSPHIGSLTSGRIGLRLMGSRASEFKNFNVQIQP